MWKVSIGDMREREREGEKVGWGTEIEKENF